MRMPQKINNLHKEVLGFRKRNAKEYTSYDGYVRQQFEIDKDKLIPVVSIDWLEKYCEKHEIKEGFGMMPFVPSHDLLTEAKKEVKK